MIFRGEIFIHYYTYITYIYSKTIYLGELPCSFEWNCKCLVPKKKELSFQASSRESAIYSGVLPLQIPLCKENDCSSGLSFQVYVKTNKSILASTFQELSLFSVQIYLVFAKVNLDLNKQLGSLAVCYQVKKVNLKAALI